MSTMNAYQRIVVGTDGSALAEPTVARAAFLAATEGADLIIVCAYSDLPRRVDARNVATLGGDPSFGQVPGREAAARVVAEANAIAEGLGAKVASVELVDGEPGTALLRVAKAREADLIVIGAHRNVSIAERLLGTVATHVVRHAASEVLIVRPNEGWGDLQIPENPETDRMGHGPA